MTAANSVDFTADGSGVDYATFRSHMVDAFDYDFGGVIDADTDDVDWFFGQAATKVLPVYPTPGTYYQAVPGSIQSQPISNSGLWTPMGASHALSIELGPVANGAAQEGVIECGFTVLSKTANDLPVDYGTVTATALLSGGGTLTATRQIQEAAGEGDTFFGFVAPSGQLIRSVSVDYDAWPNVAEAVCVDDLGFVTSPIVAAPTQIRRDIAASDGQATSDDGVAYTFNAAGSIMEVGLDDGGPGQARGMIEFPLSALAGGNTVQSASLLADVWSFSFDVSPELFPSVAVYAHGGDGVLDPADVTAAGDLIGRFNPITESGHAMIDLDPAVLQALIDGGHDFVTLVMVQESDGLDARFITSEGGSSSMVFIEPTMTVEYASAEQVLPGDANLDGIVDLDDFVLLKKNYFSGITWGQGDFDGSLSVDLDDFVVLKKNFLTTAVLPEPGSLTLLLGGLLPAALRRRRRG